MLLVLRAWDLRDQPGSSRSARRVINGPSPGCGAGVIHRRCLGPVRRPPVLRSVRVASRASGETTVHVEGRAHDGCAPPRDDVADNEERRKQIRAVLNAWYRGDVFGRRAMFHADMWPRRLCYEIHAVLRLFGIEEGGLLGLRACVCVVCCGKGSL